VGSYGDGGDVEQWNRVDSDATAVNLNALKQDADQDQSGSGTQAIGQEAKNEQSAIALSGAFQHGASNSNTPVRVDSKGDDGDVAQSNSVDSDATALNVNLTKQDADQEQGGHGDCGCHGIGIQAIGQEAKNEQGALAASLAAQAGASNENTPVSVDSYGHGGSVEQSNSVDSDATAANLNALKQDADQKQHGGAGIAIQAIGQSAKNEQGALGLSAALQFGASNSNNPVAVDNKGHGKGHSKGRSGDVTQSNSVDSAVTALNLNLTEQDADQYQSSRSCGCHGATGIQAIGQEAKNEQGALAGSLAVQAFGRGKCGCPSGGNSNTPVGVGSYGSGGSVDQSNSVDSSATALNLNALFQDADQDQGAGGGTQAIGQSAKNRQYAIGLSAALQLAADNGRMIAV
jgi:ribosomal protein L24